MIWFWVIVSIFLGIGELLTVEFLLLWFALGAAAAAVIAKFLPFVYQLGGFVLVSFLLTVLSRRLLNRKEIKTNIAALIGAEALVIETVQRVYCDKGLVRVCGEVWRAFSDDEEIPAGQRVEILDVVGTKLKVTAKR